MPTARMPPKKSHQNKSGSLSGDACDAPVAAGGKGAAAGRAFFMGKNVRFDEWSRV